MPIWFQEFHEIPTMKVHSDLKEHKQHESLFLQATDTFRKHKIHSTFAHLSYSVQHEGMPAVRDDSWTELSVVCAGQCSGPNRLEAMRSDPDSQQVTKRRNNDTKMGDHERSDSRTSRLHCTKTKHVCMLIAHQFIHNKLKCV
jgi:hypothetical protein